MLLHFVRTCTIDEFIQNENLKDLGTIRVVVISIYGRSAKSINLVVSNGLGDDDTQTIVFYPQFYFQYV
jgi:hypothetical protein